MVAFYKHDIISWQEGTASLSDGAYRLYHVIVEQIMLNEGPIRLHPRMLAGLCNSRPEVITRYHLPELIRLGKVTLDGDMLWNERCKRELDQIADNRRNAGKGGRSRAATSPTTPRYGAATSPDHARPSADIFPQEEYARDIKGSGLAPLSSDTKPKREEKSREEIETSSLCPKRVRTPYPDDFEIFWSRYPTDQNMSKKQAGKVWQRLSAEDREKAIASLPAYNAYCQAHPDYRPKHAEGYLSQAKFEGHLAAAQKIASRSVYIERGTPQWTAWDAYYRKTKGSAPPTDARGGWSFPTEWPQQETAA
jgi:hypothetical protein